MRHFRYFAIAATLAFSSVITSAHAQIDGVINRTNMAPTIDGNGSDAVWSQATVYDMSDGTSLFFGDGDGPVEGSANLSFSWRGLWDDSNLYVLIESQDDVLIFDDSNDWQDDSVEIYIDAQDTNSTDYRADQNPNTPAYQLTGLAGVDPIIATGDRFNKDPAIQMNSSFTHGTNSYAGDSPPNNYPQGADTSISSPVNTGDTSWTFEVAFPWTALEETPQDIQERGSFGFGIAYNDDDDGGGRDNQVMWGVDAFDLWMNAATMPAVELIGVASEPIQLQVNTETGEAFLHNPNAEDVILSKELDGYTISSESGSLNPGGWNSLADNDGEPDFGDGWDEANAASDRLTELNLTGEASLGPLESRSIGNIFGGDGGGNPDVDGNGTVDGNDLLIIQRNGDNDLMDAFNSQFGGPGSGGGGGPGVEDLVFSYTQGGFTTDSTVVYLNGGGAAAVPEPATCGLLAVCASMLAFARRRKTGAAMLAALLTTLVTAPQINAAEVHRYTFNDGTANDSIGGANGTLVDPNGIASPLFGKLDLSQNNGASSNDDPFVGAYVDLPNFIISDLGDQASFEIWFTVDEQRNFARLFDFGSSDGGEDSSSSGEFSFYITAQAQTGGGVVQLEVRDGTFDPAFAANINDGVTSTTAAVQHHLVATWDGSFGAETATLYLDGVEVASSALDPGISPGNLNDNNNWLGRSQWNDSLFDGTFDEFRIYDSVLSAQDVADNTAAGPTPYDGPLPAVSLDRDTREVTLTNNGTQDLVITGYSVTSAFGSLDPSQWATQLDTQTSSTTGELAEELSSGSASVGPGETISMGPVWIASPTEDLGFSLTLDTDQVWNTVILAEGNGDSPFVRSDLDFDGNIAVSDYAILTDNIFSDLSGLSPAQAYGRGDLTGDGENNLDDFNVFKADFIAANGEAAFAALVAGVPEPTSIALLAIASLALLARSRRQ